MRQSNRIAKAAALDSSANFLTSSRRLVAESAEVAHIVEVGLRDPNELSDEERLRFRTFLHNVFVAFSNSYRQGRLASSNKNEIEPTLVALRRYLGPPGTTWFWHQYREEFDASFRSVVDRIFEEVEPSP